MSRKYNIDGVTPKGKGEYLVSVQEILVDDISKEETPSHSVTVSFYPAKQTFADLKDKLSAKFQALKNKDDNVITKKSEFQAELDNFDPYVL